jgi:hypothetical protein
MARFDGDDVSAKGTPGQRQIADDIENFVTDKFIGKSQRFLAQYGTAAIYR